MIEAMLLKLGVRNAGRAAAVLSIAALLALAGFGAWRAMAAVERAVEAVRQDVRDERDVHWRGVIAEANGKAEAAAAEQARVAAWHEGRAREDISRMAAQLTEMERANHALANGDACGLDRDRVRLLQPR